ncbi:MAG: peptidase M26, partial [Parabacteroides sp.]|nr:peptidase M26 [Parabacteroides sp.]
MKTNYFFLLFFLLILMGCSDDKNIPDIPASTEDTYEGVHDLISFTKETEDFTYGDLTFHIKTPDGNIIQRKAKHRRLSGTSLFTMEKGLKEGKYQLLYMEYTIQSDCPDIDGRNGEFGMGCYITVSENGISTETNRDERIGLYGNGTPEDPYRITSADDLAKIQEAILNFHNNGNLVNSSTCFEQQNDISMANYNDQCGWEGNWYQIGLSASYPFTGYYDGNGYTIRDLKMLDKNAVGASLFGFVNQAIISNLTIEKATITGYGALSAIVGAVTTKGGSINKTFIKGCVVKKSTIESRSDGVVTDGMAIGGIAGMVDPNVNLWIDSCSVEDCTINGAIAVGGILGGGTVYSMTQITNSHNRNTKVTASYNCAGGIVGYADTLYVYSCSNNGTIKGAASTTAPPGNLPANSIYNVGAGGIAGGSGLSTIISSRNSGTVQGSRGVGGIIGSTLVTTQPKTYYNNTFIGFCSNSGNINGDSYIGGLCGEAQLGAYKSYNEGMIEANSSFAGGILGFAPLASITNTANFNKVIASSYSGGIAGSILAGSLGINTNL